MSDLMPFQAPKNVRDDQEYFEKWKDEVIEEHMTNVNSDFYPLLPDNFLEAISNLTYESNHADLINIVLCLSAGREKDMAQVGETIRYLAIKYWRSVVEHKINQAN